MCGETDQPEAPEHGVKEVFWAKLGEGWFFTCLCGWQTNTDRSLSLAAVQLEDHWRDKGAL